MEVVFCVRLLSLIDPKQCLFLLQLFLKMCSGKQNLFALIDEFFNIIDLFEKATICLRNLHPVFFDIQVVLQP